MIGFKKIEIPKKKNPKKKCSIANNPLPIYISKIPKKKNNKFELFMNSSRIHALKSIAMGQVLSLTTCVCSLASGLLATRHGVNAPAFQSLPNYILLSLCALLALPTVRRALRCTLPRIAIVPVAHDTNHTTSASSANDVSETASLVSSNNNNDVASNFINNNDINRNNNNNNNNSRSSSSNSSSSAGGVGCGSFGGSSVDVEAALLASDNDVFCSQSSFWRRAFRYYLPLAIIDVEANYAVVLAFQYTDVASVMLIDCW